MREEKHYADCPMCGSLCTVEGEDGSTCYYAPLQFTREEIECIQMTSILALRVLADYCDEHPGADNKRRDLIIDIAAKCGVILKGGAE